MFRITPRLGKSETGKGFQITFSNGWTASVQWGLGMYCHSRDEEMAKESKTAEVAAIAPNGDFVPMNPKDLDCVKGWQSPNEVLGFLNWVAAQAPEEETEA